MSHVNAQRHFDVSDVDSPIVEDKLDDVLGIAAEVLAEYGEDPVAMKTRIARLAQWLVLNVGGEPHQTEQLEKGCERHKVHEHAFPLVRVGSVYAIERRTEDLTSISGTHVAFAVGSEAARAYAVALLRATERDD